MDHPDFIDTIVSLYKENKWQEIIALGENIKIETDARKLLWVWPSEKNINFMQEMISKLGLKGIISIGCGSGLFEWLLQQGTSLPVVGYEVNKEWWTSKYCCPQFITLEYPDLPPRNGCLREHYALLFCYFNNGPAFSDYMNVYQGNLVFIIGPDEGKGTHTNPEPFKATLGSDWKLYDFQEVRSTKDFIAAYVRT